MMAGGSEGDRGEGKKNWLKKKNREGYVRPQDVH